MEFIPREIALVILVLLPFVAAAVLTGYFTLRVKEARRREEVRFVCRLLRLR